MQAARPATELSDITATAPCRLLSVVRMGFFANEVLADQSDVEVIAVFRRSAYLRLAGGLVCLGDPAIGDAPLNLLFQYPTHEAFASMAPGMRGRLLPERMTLPGLTVTLAGAAMWSPPALLAQSPTRIRGATSLLDQMLPANVPGEGLGPLIRRDAVAATLVQRAAAPALAALAAWADGRSGAPLPRPAIAALLGLGPGLTPSGDDALAGFAVGLALLGATGLRDRLAREVLAQAQFGTNEISTAHLMAAMRGGLAADLHRVVDAAVAEDRVALGHGFAALAKGGHNSPWDALAGLITALRGRAC